ncbi:MAG: CAP domain-containing protein [Pseudomonadota bacterium]
MPRRCTLWGILFVAAFACICPDGTAYGRNTAANAKQAVLTPGQIETARNGILLYTNRERTRRGLPPLRSSAALNYLAQAQSANMCAALPAANRGSSQNKCLLPNFNHESDLFPPGWRAFSDRLGKADLNYGAENIACRTLDPDLDKWARIVVLGWMNSKPGHHGKNILSRGHRFLGVGVVGCLERIGYATQVFSNQSGRIVGNHGTGYGRRISGVYDPVIATIPARK